MSASEFYGRLLRINNSMEMRPTTIIMNSTMVAGAKYVSATDCGAGVAGVCVGE